MLLMGCGFTSSRESAEAGVREFHARLDARQFDAILDSASEELLASANRQTLMDFLAQTRNEYGTLIDLNLLGATVNKQSDATIVSLQYRARFTLKIAQEEFVFVVDNHSAQLLQFGIHALIGSTGDLQT